MNACLPIETPRPNGGDLLASITRLVDRLTGATSAGDADIDALDLLEAAERALLAALRAEKVMADQKDRIDDLERLATTDELTGLLNRRGFEDELRHVLAAARRYDEEGVLVYIDLDGFKPINDTYGHAAGDEVLKQVARVLGENVRETDYVGRLGGDEFAVVLTRTPHGQAVLRAEVLDRMLNAACLSWQGQMIRLRASIGVRAFGADDADDDLLHQADTAMYQSKRSRADGRLREVA